MSLFYDTNVNATLERIAIALEGIRFQGTKPGLLKLISLSEPIMSVISFKVILPQPVDSDVVTRSLSVQIDDNIPEITEVSPDTAEVDGFEGLQDAKVKLSLVDVDDAGNPSQPSTLDVVLLDTFAPPQPGLLGIVATGEQSS